MRLQEKMAITKLVKYEVKRQFTYQNCLIRQNSNVFQCCINSEYWVHIVNNQDICKKCISFALGWIKWIYCIVHSIIYYKPCQKVFRVVLFRINNISDQVVLPVAIHKYIRVVLFSLSFIIIEMNKFVISYTCTFSVLTKRNAISPVSRFQFSFC